jgi:hypothetical protein
LKYRESKHDNHDIKNGEGSDPRKEKDLINEAMHFESD